MYFMSGLQANDSCTVLLASTERNKGQSIVSKVFLDRDRNRKYRCNGHSIIIDYVNDDKVYVVN